METIQKEKVFLILLVGILTFAFIFNFLIKGNVATHTKSLIQPVGGMTLLDGREVLVTPSGNIVASTDSNLIKECLNG